MTIRKKFEEVISKHGYNSVSDFASKTGRQRATVLNHLKNGVFDIRLLRAYAKDLKMTFFEVLELFGLEHKVDVLETLKEFGFADKKVPVNNDESLAIFMEGSSFKAIKAKVIDGEVEPVCLIDMKFIPDHKEIQQYIIRKICKV